jgi:hypothetical protein
MFRYICFTNLKHLIFETEGVVSFQTTPIKTSTSIIPIKMDAFEQDKNGCLVFVFFP